MNQLSDQKIKDIVKALDDAIEQGPWEQSNFLRVIGKNLRDIRDDFVNEINASGHHLVKESVHQSPANQIALRSGQQELFISLYSSDGAQLHSWERILSNLPNQMVSRPIYASEEDVQAFIKTKKNKINEAYVAIYVNQSDILSQTPDKISIDPLGKALISLKSKALQLENVNRFIHTSGVYQYNQGRLIKQSTDE